MFHKTNTSHFSNIDYANESLSFASTNKDSNMTSSQKGNSYYNFFRNKNSLKRKYDCNDFEENEKGANINNIRIQSYLCQIVNKENKNEKNSKSSRMNYNYHPKDYYSSFNAIYKNNIDKNSLINKTINILNLKKETHKQNKAKIVSSNFLSFKQNKNKKIQKKANAKKKLDEKNNNSQRIIKTKNANISENHGIKHKDKKNTNNVDVKKKFDINKEKKVIELMKKQYIKNIKSTHALFHDIKNKMSNINEFQKNILELNNKSLKYSSLSQEDNLKKYKEENRKNLKEYKLKKIEVITKRPFSCNDIKSKRKTLKMVKKKILNEKVINKIEKREKDIKEKLNNIKNYNNINIQCYNSLRFFNEVLNNNKEKKSKFYNYIKQKANKNRYFSQNVSVNIKI